MIDIESLVFDTVYNSLHQTYPSVNITAGYDEKTATFPTVVVRETGNVPVQQFNTDDCAENYARLTYEIEVYSDKLNIGRSECKELLDAVDGIMQGMKFRRIHKNRPINTDRTVWRQYARYEVIVGKGITTTTGEGQEAVTTTVYQMYRRT